MFPKIQALEKKIIQLAFLADYGLHKLVCYLDSILPRHKEEINSQGSCCPLLFGKNTSDSRKVLEALAHLQASNPTIC